MTLTNLARCLTVNSSAKNVMTAKVFLDTNIVLYAVGQDAHKKAIARQLLSTSPMVSAQVINECVNVCLKKFKFDKNHAYAFADAVMSRVNVLPVDEAVIRKSAELAMAPHCPIGMPWLLRLLYWLRVKHFIPRICRTDRFLRRT